MCEHVCAYTYTVSPWAISEPVQAIQGHLAAILQPLKGIKLSQQQTPTAKRATETQTQRHRDTNTEKQRHRDTETERHREKETQTATEPVVSSQ